MQRVAVIGCGGSGKTTAARELGRRLDLPVVHLDLVDGAVADPGAVRREELASLAAAERWVIDGLKLATLSDRLARADTVVFCDLPRRWCYLGVLQRRLRHRGRVVPELGVADRLSLGFLRWIWRFPRDTRPRLVVLLAEHRNVVVLRSRRQVRRWLVAAAGRDGACV